MARRTVKPGTLSCMRADDGLAAAMSLGDAGDARHRLIFSCRYSVAVVGCCQSRASCGLLVGGQGWPQFCDFCVNQLVGDAGASHILLACPAWAIWARQWLVEVDLAFSRTPAACGASAWWRRLRREPPSRAAVAAALTTAGCPQIPAGVLGVLRSDLAQGFVQTAGACAARKVEWIDSLPPAR